MNFAQLYILIAALAGVVLFWTKTQPKLLKALLIGLLVCAAAGFSKQNYFIDSSFFLFGILALIFSIYSYLNKKWLAFVIGGFAMLSVCSSFFMYDYVGLIRYFMVVPIIAMLVVIKDWKKHSSELAILMVFSVYEYCQFLQAVFE